MRPPRVAIGNESVYTGPAFDDVDPRNERSTSETRYRCATYNAETGVEVHVFTVGVEIKSALEMFANIRSLRMLVDTMLPGDDGVMGPRSPSEVVLCEETLTVNSRPVQSAEHSDGPRSMTLYKFLLVNTRSRPAVLRTLDIPMTSDKAAIHAAESVAHAINDNYPVGHGMRLASIVVHRNDHGRIFDKQVIDIS